MSVSFSSSLKFCSSPPLYGSRATVGDPRVFDLPHLLCYTLASAVVHTQLDIDPGVTHSVLAANYWRIEFNKVN